MKCKLACKDDIIKADVFCINNAYLNGDKCKVFISRKNRFTDSGKIFLNNEVKKEWWEIINE